MIIKTIPVRNIGPIEEPDHHYIPSYITDELQTYFKDGMEYVATPKYNAQIRNQRNLKRKHERTQNTGQSTVLEMPGDNSLVA